MGSRCTPPQARAGVGALLAIPPNIMLAILLILLVISLLGGGFGYRSAGVLGMSPAAIIVIILVVMALTGRL
jgi:hypothetical protein